ncbi:pyruvate dehydrogenase E2 component (dihydrolipoamide acetyltransferase) [Actinoalloteichus hoggarensis]|uniref:Acetyltransferase component of pyruvate dehydrogenase complex n=1 Tax=Actinoalloteichus hoggarensis TaxID=1470176 RepID=A0A221W2Q8_9PSEU|nr:pyruvate dehydrogenase complex dihydrolipoamide acetyltransferase [Actinoalloteichus hoggarensis]ASO19891.1 Dihydrolipoyllysine-residue acetyltransferase component of pyruvate dehydrogenase complex [Actinoalloteichus hoggarensis]MBB5919400.1 pyruvate dehydrogenase E2 component (dihydrolipoamide acetyltransferase) [Actinoalloteichus hoggarensis]
MTEIQMPRLSDTMEEGVISAWVKQEGDTISRGDVVAEIETDKAVMELEAYDDGVLEKILVPAGELVPIGATIGLLGDGSGSASAAPAAPSTTAPEGTGAAESAAAAESTDQTEAPADVSSAAPRVDQAPTPAGSRPRSSPLARKIAREAGIDLDTVAGSGPRGRIVRADVDAAVAAKQSADAAAPAQQAEPTETAAPSAPRTGIAADTEDVEEIPLSGIRRVAAKRLTESKQQAPHFYLTSAVDVTELLGFRADLTAKVQAAGGPKVSINDLLVKAVATALRANPTVNVSFAGDKILQHKRIHLGIAVAIESGLVVPVLRDADRKSVSELASEAREKAGRAREGRLKTDEMTGGTFTISNLGMFGIEEFAAVINPPEAAILAVGAVRDELRLRAEGKNKVEVRKIMRITLSADHRAVDGAVGAVFLQQLTALLEDPIRIIA